MLAGGALCLYLQRREIEGLEEMILFFFSWFKSSSEIQYFCSQKKKKSLSCMRLVLKTNKGSAGALTFIDLGWVMNWMVCKEIIHILRLTLRNITHKWLQMLVPIVPLRFCLFINFPCLPSNAQNVLLCKKPLPLVLKKNTIYWTKYYAREFVSKNIFSPRTDFSSSPISVLAFFLCAGFSNLFKHF